ncbi:MAG: beta-propeller fold lactonase family protein [Deltaproteobacteria bacterium]
MAPVRLLSTSLCLTLAFVGCNAAEEEPADTTPPRDGGMRRTIETPRDGGVVRDGGEIVDAGTTTDAGVIEAPDAPAAVYTLSNDPTGNAVLVYARSTEDGALTFLDSFPTGGMGSGMGLGSQGGLVFDDATDRFFAVNAGDDTVSMLALHEDGTLESLSTVDAQGVAPVSITARGDLVYVVNAGDEAVPANIAGFSITNDALAPIEGSSRALSMAAVGPGQIEFSPDGSSLIVTEKGTDSIDIFPVVNGVADPAITHASVGMTPFGFAFRDDGHLIVSEAFGGADNAGATSTYALGTLDGTLSAVSAAVRTEQSAPCWVVLAGSFAYVTNTASDNVSGYDIGADGSLTYTWSAPTGDAPIDAIVADDFLYILNAADDSFSIYAVNTSNGTLQTLPTVTGLPADAVGVAAGPRAIYTMSNADTGNDILAYVRAIDGGLTFLGSTASGGVGRGRGLGSQNAIVHADGLVFAVNAGDHTVSMLRVETDGSLTLLDTASAGGVSPRSVAVDGDLVYVANAGDDDNGANISGLRIDGDSLTPIPGSSRPMSAENPGPGQISFADEGALLVLTEKGTDHITTYAVTDGLAGTPVVHTSHGRTPFGFAITDDGAIVVSEAAGGDAGEGTASSYRVSSAGSLETMAASVESGQSAPCWVAIYGDYAYVTNTRSDNVTAYAIGANGALTLLWSAQAGDGPLDAATTEDAYLYVLNGRDDTISIYAIGDEGVLLQRPSLQDLPETAVGLVAR